MKEAAGEANMTVITIVLIGVVAAVGAVLIPRIMKGLDQKSCCSENGGYWFKNACYRDCTLDDATNKVSKCAAASQFTPECK